VSPLIILGCACAKSLPQREVSKSMSACMRYT